MHSIICCEAFNLPETWRQPAEHKCPTITRTNVSWVTDETPEPLGQRQNLLMVGLKSLIWSSRSRMETIWPLVTNSWLWRHKHLIKKSSRTWTRTSDCAQVCGSFVGCNGCDYGSACWSVSSDRAVTGCIFILIIRLWLKTQITTANIKTYDTELIQDLLQHLPVCPSWNMDRHFISSSSAALFWASAFKSPSGSQIL